MQMILHWREASIPPNLVCSKALHECNFDGSVIPQLLNYYKFSDDLLTIFVL